METGGALDNDRSGLGRLLVQLRRARSEPLAQRLRLGEAEHADSVADAAQPALALRRRVAVVPAQPEAQDARQRLQVVSVVDAHLCQQYAACLFAHDQVVVDRLDGQRVGRTLTRVLRSPVGALQDELLHASSSSFSTSAELLSTWYRFRNVSSQAKACTCSSAFMGSTIVRTPRDSNATRRSFGLWPSVVPSRMNCRS